MPGYNPQKAYAVHPKATLMPVLTKRVYEPREPSDGSRLLVMRYWPRGIAKARIDGWNKGLSPSIELLRGLRSGDIAWQEYVRSFLWEMESRDDAVVAISLLREQARTEIVTLLCWCNNFLYCHRTLLNGIVEQS